MPACDSALNPFYTFTFMHVPPGMDVYWHAGLLILLHGVCTWGGALDKLFA
jgi:hypothetical protein